MVFFYGNASKQMLSIPLYPCFRTVSVGLQMPIKHVPIYAGREPTVFDSFIGLILFYSPDALDPVHLGLLITGTSYPLR